MRVRRLGDNGLVLRILMVELKAVAISVLSPVAVAQHALDGHAVEVGAIPPRTCRRGSGSLGTGSQCWPEVCGNAQAVGATRQSDLSMPESVGDLGAVERAHGSIKFCAASLLRAVVQI
jgi:hypothetical protein